MWRRHVTSIKALWRWHYTSNSIVKKTLTPQSLGQGDITSNNIIMKMTFNSNHSLFTRHLPATTALWRRHVKKITALWIRHLTEITVLSFDSSSIVKTTLPAKTASSRRHYQQQQHCQDDVISISIIMTTLPATVLQKNIIDYLAITCLLFAIRDVFCVTRIQRMLSLHSLVGSLHNY